MRSKIILFYLLAVLMCPAFSSVSSEDVSIYEICEKRAYVCVHDGSRVLIGEKNKFARWFKGNFNENSARKSLVIPDGNNQHLNGMNKSQLMTYVGCEERVINGDMYCIYGGSDACPNGFPITNYPGKKALPGGKANKGETIWDAATREFAEEVGHLNFSERKVVRYKGRGMTFVEGIDSTKKARRFEIGGEKFDALYIRVSQDELTNIARAFNKKLMQETREKISKEQNLSRLPLHSDEFKSVGLANIYSVRTYFSNENIDWFKEILNYAW